MAIGTGDAIEKFGTQAAITNAGISINQGAMSTQANAIAWTNSDNAAEASFVLECTFSANPATGRSVDLFARPLNVRGASDRNQPSIGDNENVYIGSFALDSSTTTQVSTLRGILYNNALNQQYEFYLKNGANNNITSAQAWITPIAIGPAA